MGALPDRQEHPPGVGCVRSASLAAVTRLAVDGGRRRPRWCRPRWDLGLRSCEVARLRFDDIDWHAGAVALRQGPAEDVRLLPAATGEAIVAYLQHERPKTANRAIFVRHVAPRDEPVGPDLVRKSLRG